MIRWWRIARFKWDAFTHHTILGITSGIPACCIAYWLRLKMNGLGSLPHPYLSRLRPPKPEGDAQYIQCDRCYRLGRVKPVKYDTWFDQYERRRLHKMLKRLNREILQ